MFLFKDKNTDKFDISAPKKSQTSACFRKYFVDISHNSSLMHLEIVTLTL